MLARRSLSWAEMTERLVRKGFDGAAVALEVKRLAAVKLLDDEALAARVCEEALARGQGRRAATATLLRRKIPQHIVRRTLDALSREAVDAALERSFERAGRKHAGWRTDRRQRDKVIRFLLARGFDLDAVKRIVSRGPADAASPVDRPT
jgi:SOS response regulatory protein OraA/RecX